MQPSLGAEPIFSIVNFSQVRTFGSDNTKILARLNSKLSTGYKPIILLALRYFWEAEQGTSTPLGDDHVTQVCLLLA
eukprot:8789919-Ditylum_brightwellii.AAC.1